MMSMTGFGAATFKNDKIDLSVHIKSVNGRFLELRFKLPKEYSALEQELRKKISQEVSRGSVDVYINKTLGVQAEDIDVTPNVPLAKAWVKAAQTLSDELNINNTLRLETLMRMPDVIQTASIDEISSSEKKALFSTIEEALKNHSLERKREGEALKKHIEELLAQLKEILTDIQNQKIEIDKHIQTRLQERLHERLKSLEVQVPLDPQRLTQEVVYLLEKADISEELERAFEHIKMYLETLKQKSTVGKKLEFYTQELHREVNTLGAKTQNIDIVKNMIDAKLIVEKLREQIQNIE